MSRLKWPSACTVVVWWPLFDLCHWIDPNTHTCIVCTRTLILVLRCLINLAYLVCHNEYYLQWFLTHTHTQLLLITIRRLSLWEFSTNERETQLPYNVDVNSTHSPADTQCPRIWGRGRRQWWKNAPREMDGCGGRAENGKSTRGAPFGCAGGQKSSPRTDIDWFELEKVRYQARQHYCYL